MRLETVVIALFSILVATFIVEIRLFFESGEWVIHGGVGEFKRWPQPSSNNMIVLLHSVGMLVWVGIVMYQLYSRGSGAHKAVGYFGAVLVVVSLLSAWGPMLDSVIPFLHSVYGVTAIDITLMSSVAAIIEETIVGVLKARGARRNLQEHRQHLMTAILFTAAPGLYRVYVIAGRYWLPVFPDDPTLRDVWVHELSHTLATITGVIVLLTPPFGGHVHFLAKLPRKGGRPPWTWQYCVAKFMMGFGALLLTFYIVSVVDLVLMTFQATPPAVRTDKVGAPVIAFPAVFPMLQ